MSAKRRRAKVLPELSPHRLECKLWGKRLNEDGQQVGEEEMSNIFNIFEADFDNLRSLIEEGIAAARKREAQDQ